MKLAWHCNANDRFATDFAVSISTGALRLVVMSQPGQIKLLGHAATGRCKCRWIFHITGYIIQRHGQMASTRMEGNKIDARFIEFIEQLVATLVYQLLILLT